MAASTKRLSKSEESKLRGELDQANNTVRQQAAQIGTLQENLRTEAERSNRLQEKVDGKNEENIDLSDKVEELKGEVESLKEQISHQSEQAAESRGFARGNSQALNALLEPIVNTMCRKLEGNGKEDGHRHPRHPLEALIGSLNAQRPAGAPRFEDFLAASLGIGDLVRD